MEFLVKATVKIENPTPEDLLNIKTQIRNTLMSFGHDINVIVDYAPTYEIKAT